LSAAFDFITQRMTEVCEEDKAGPKAAKAHPVASPSPARSEATPAAAEAKMTAGSGTDDGEAGRSIAGLQDGPVLAKVEAVDVTAEVVDKTADAADMTVEAAEVATETADAQDDAILDLIALEMAAPDPSDLDDPRGRANDEIRSTASPPGDPVMVAPNPEPPIAPAQPAALQPPPQPSPQLAPEASLGSSLIASGIVRRPPASKTDPLAPIQRLSQAEKIAFFS
jgi:hypothetical protein